VVAAGLARQQDRGGRDLVRQPEPAERQVLDDGFGFGEFVGEGRLDRAGCDRVDGDPARGNLPRQRLRQPERAGLRGAVLSEQRRALECELRRDVDDPSLPRRAHGGRAAAQPGIPVGRRA
jgi:hypothetical protein